EILREELFAKVKPVILTSATLVTEKRFDYIKSRLGLDDCRELLLGSPFDYEQNTGLYIAEDLPDPNWQTEAYHHKVIERIKELLSITGGRTFILFTSFWMLNHTSDEIRGIPLSILRQGVLPRYLLLEEFKRSPDAVLLGTNTFWQGIDVPGAALQCIIIAKLPFTVPDDPVTEARMDVLKAQGKDPFIHYQIPQAIMMLRQGFGRLIRTKTDKGMVAILDPRIKTRFYGQRFLDSLPPCRRLHTLSEIEEYFSALAHQNSL
ncbi:MAG TPA: helicase c2, partial [Candidatus Omnitrophica bacterium]|nr:helicase c2 [Candidatus Omnitrophota bacterium]